MKLCIEARDKFKKNCVCVCVCACTHTIHTSLFLKIYQYTILKEKDYISKKPQNCPFLPSTNPVVNTRSPGFKINKAQKWVACWVSQQVMIRYTKMPAPHEGWALRHRKTVRALNGGLWCDREAGCHLRMSASLSEPPFTQCLCPSLQAA